MEQTLSVVCQLQAATAVGHKALLYGTSRIFFVVVDPMVKTRSALRIASLLEGVMEESFESIK